MEKEKRLEGEVKDYCESLKESRATFSKEEYVRLVEKSGMHVEAEKLRCNFDGRGVI